MEFQNKEETSHSRFPADQKGSVSSGPLMIDTSFKSEPSHGASPKDVQERNAWLQSNWHRLMLTVILLFGAALRLIPFTDITNGSFHFVGTCGQLFEEAKPLFDARNPLYFEVFFYPPVPAMVVASSALVLQKFLPINFASYCLLLNVSVSIATPLIVYLIGKQWGTKVGLTAAALYSVAMIAIYSSDNIQMYPTFFAMLALLFFFKSLEVQTTFNLALMGLFFGLAVASKYFPVLLFLMLVLVHLATSKKRRLESVSYDRSCQDRSLKASWSVACNVAIWSAVSLAIICFYLAYFKKPMLLSFFKSIYDRYPHENNFTYHVATIEHLYQFGVLSISVVACLFVILAYVMYKSRLGTAEWLIAFYLKHRLWVIPVATAGITLVVSIGIPAGINLHNYLKYTTWIAKSYASADGGFFPSGRPAPSYLLSYFPENLGLPLFIVSIIGLAYCLYLRERKIILLFVISLPLYIALELSAVKVNRFSMDLMPILCLFAAIGMVSLFKRNQSVAIRSTIVLINVSVLFYSSLYSLAWGNLQRSLSEVPQETISWITTNVPGGSRIGMKAQLWILGSPGLLPDPDKLTSYHIDEYRKYPDFIVLPKLLHAIMQQYVDLTQLGYVYSLRDWSPLPPPAPGETEVLVDLVNKEHYELLAEFERQPSVFGITFSPQAIRGKTWFLEHTGSYGIQVYKKRGEPEQASLGSVSMVP